MAKKQRQQPDAIIVGGATILNLKIDRDGGTLGMYLTYGSDVVSEFTIDALQAQGLIAELEKLYPQVN